MWMLIARGVIAGVVVFGVAVLSNRYPKWGAFLLTLPLVSILAFVATWQQKRDLPSISQVARETLVLVPLGLPFFIPLAFAHKLGLGFWSAFALGFLLATITVGLWLWLGPKSCDVGAEGTHAMKWATREKVKVIGWRVRG
jgi:hypothetical protein